MKKSMWNLALLLGLSPFLVQCVASGQQMNSVELRLRNMDTKMVTMERDLNALSNQNRGQADIGVSVDLVETELLQVKGHLEETNRRFNELEKQNKEQTQQMNSRLDQRLQAGNDRLQGEVDTKLNAMEEKVAQLSAQLAQAMAEIEAVKDARAKDATERAMAAARAAREAEERAQQQAAAPTGKREIVPTQVKKKVSGQQETKPAATSTAASPEDSLYDKALDLFKAGKYKEAYSGFQTYIEKNPKGDMLPNARFWVGDCLFKQNEYELAILEYQKVIADYPKHDKAPAALLKQGLAFEKLKDLDTAKLVYQKLMEDYPKSEQAETAGKWLKEH